MSIKLKFHLCTPKVRSFILTAKNVRQIFLSRCELMATDRKAPKIWQRNRILCSSFINVIIYKQVCMYINLFIIVFLQPLLCYYYIYLTAPWDLEIFQGGVDISSLFLAYFPALNSQMSILAAFISLHNCTLKDGGYLHFHAIKKQSKPKSIL